MVHQHPFFPQEESERVVKRTFRTVNYNKIESESIMKPQKSKKTCWYWKKGCNNSSCGFLHPGKKRSLNEVDEDLSDDESKNKLRIVEKTFLIPNARVGALIGKGGHRIKTLQKTVLQAYLLLIQIHLNICILRYILEVLPKT